MSSALIWSTLLAFAIGTAVAWVQARRRLRAQLRDRLVAEAEQRIRQEIIRRVSEEAAKQVRTTNAVGAGENQPTKRSA